MVTTVDNEDWESQLEQMMSERDATDVADSFKKIIESFDEDEPVATLEIMVGEDDIHAWLPALHQFLEANENNLEEAVKDMLWNVGLQLIQAYMGNDDVAPLQACTEAVKWFLNPEDDEDDDDDDSSGVS
jgi:hypothetical protein